VPTAEPYYRSCMPTWLAPVLSAVIAATAVVVTNWLNSRHVAAQRLQDGRERAADRANELEKWRKQRDQEWARWLLERRAEAYTALWEWMWRDAEDPTKKERASTIDVAIQAYGSAAVVDAYLAWYKDDSWQGTVREDPRWQYLVDRMRYDLGSTDL
jgi:hypothetical protein